MVLQPIVEPVVLAFEADQLRISSDSARRRNRDKSSFTSASAAWRTGRAVLGEPLRRFCFRDDRENRDRFDQAAKSAPFLHVVSCRPAFRLSGRRSRIARARCSTAHVLSRSGAGFCAAFESVSDALELIRDPLEVVQRLAGESIEKSQAA
jgi:hypothetical protein